jgi:hypothetical protein
LKTFFPGLLVIGIGLTIGGWLTGNWYIFGLVIGYYMLFFFIETRILCSHCPYYSESSMVLHCLANYGFIKLFRYHPGPLSRFEKIILVIGFIFFPIVPIIAQGYTIFVLKMIRRPKALWEFPTLYFILVLTIVAFVYAFYTLLTKICISCVNFSCPFNKVPRKIAYQYLARNPHMNDAWNIDEKKRNRINPN